MNHPQTLAPLHGIRVLDVGKFIAGPYCATLLGDLGADVIRVEKIGGGEDRFVVPVTPSGEGGSFLQLGRNKRSIALNLAAPMGQKALRALALNSDVVVANLPHKQLVKLGLDYETLKAQAPGVILASVSAYGNTGPYADKTGFDGIGQAMSGASYLSGTPDQPQRWAATYVDYGTALASTVGTLAALLSRAQTGIGQHVSASLLNTALTFFNSNLMEAHVAGQDRTPSGNRGQQLAPCDIFATRDGHLLLQVLGEAQFARLAQLIGQTAWLQDPRLDTDAGRGKHADLICEAVAHWCATRTSQEALEALATARLPAEQVLSPRQALSHPQMLAGALFQYMAYPGMEGSVPVVAPQMTLSATPASYRSRAPLPGEHSREILAELGFDASQISETMAGG